MTNLNTEMTDLNADARELTIDQLDSASGGLSYLGIFSVVARILSGGYAPYNPVLPKIS